MSDVTIDSNGIITSPDSHLGFSDVYLSYEGRGDEMTLNYTRHYGERDGEGSCYTDGIVFHGFTPNAFDVRIVDAIGNEEVLLDWHTDYDETSYECDDDSVEEMSAEFAYALCLAVEEYFDK